MEHLSSLWNTTQLLTFAWKHGPTSRPHEFLQLLSSCLTIWFRCPWWAIYMVELFIACGLYAGARAIAVCSTASEKKDHQNESDCNCALRFFWTPVKVLYFIAYYGIPNIGYGSVAYNTSVVFVCLDSCVNPFVYSFQNERFRRGLRDLFRYRETKINNALLVNSESG